MSKLPANSLHKMTFLTQDQISRKDADDLAVPRQHAREDTQDPKTQVNSRDSEPAESVRTELPHFHHGCCGGHEPAPKLSSKAEVQMAFRYVDKLVMNLPTAEEVKIFNDIEEKNFADTELGQSLTYNPYVEVTHQGTPQETLKTFEGKTLHIQGTTFVKEPKLHGLSFSKSVDKYNYEISCKSLPVVSQVKFARMKNKRKNKFFKEMVTVDSSLEEIHNLCSLFMQTAAYDKELKSAPSLTKENLQEKQAAAARNFAANKFLKSVIESKLNSIHRTIDDIFCTVQKKFYLSEHFSGQKILSSSLQKSPFDGAGFQKGELSINVLSENPKRNEKAINPAINPDPRARTKENSTDGHFCTIDVIYTDNSDVEDDSVYKKPRSTILDLKGYSDDESSCDSIFNASNASNGLPACNCCPIDLTVTDHEPTVTEPDQGRPFAGYDDPSVSASSDLTPTNGGNFSPPP